MRLLWIIDITGRNIYWEWTVHACAAWCINVSQLYILCYSYSEFFYSPNFL